PQTSIAIMSAAVADFRPKHAAESKLKKKDGEDQMSIELVKNPDILSTLGHKKMPHQLVIGFALETDNELDNATQKLIKKNVDYIALNSLKDEAVGFGKDTNHIILLSKDNEPNDLGRDTKQELAKKMIKFILDNHQAQLLHHSR